MKGPLTRGQVDAKSAELWPGLAGENVPLGRRWLGKITPRQQGSGYLCLVASHKPRHGHSACPEATRSASTMSAARTYMHELARCIFERGTPDDLASFGTDIPGIWAEPQPP